MANYFMSKLLDFETQDVSIDDGDEECDYRLFNEEVGRSTSKKSKTHRHFREMEESSDGGGLGDYYTPTDSSSKNPMEIKQQLLHLLSTEILINTELHGKFTCVRSEFDNWGQTLPHSTIALVLTVGVSNKWLDFFVKFLQAPLKFLHDNPAVQSQVRKRGVPEFHVLSDVFGEAVLFCLDFSVNQVTGGGQLYRMHDEFWFWTSSHEKCIKAWTAVQNFGQAMGVSLNKRKSGSECILRDKEEPPTIDPALPDGEIRWGFLSLDPESGMFAIDQSLVDIYVKKLQRQLQDKASIFSWVQAWNTYAGTFFTNNFSKPANCYGQKHVDEVLASLERVQRSIFTNDGGLAEYLKITIQKRFGVSNIPDGYLYFPTDLGGLELHNTFIPLQIRDVVYGNPIEAVTQKFADAELEAYRKAKTAFENGRTLRKCHGRPDLRAGRQGLFHVL
jgi:hypothetical protein